MKGSDIFIPFPLDYLEADQVKQIGDAIWVFLWLINKTTSELDTPAGRIGVVLYGRPIGAGEIADWLGCTARTIRRHLAVLAEKGYIAIEPKGSSGQIITVRNSCKWRRRPSQATQPTQPSRPSQPWLPLNAIERLFAKKDDDDDEERNEMPAGPRPGQLA